MPWTADREWIIATTNRGAGLDASPRAMDAATRKICEQLVTEGILERAKNHSNDKCGMFVKKLSDKELAAKKKEYGIL